MDDKQVCCMCVVMLEFLQIVTSCCPLYKKKELESAVKMIVKLNKEHLINCILTLAQKGLSNMQIM